MQGPEVSIRVSIILFTELYIYNLASLCDGDSTLSSFHLFMSNFILYLENNLSVFSTYYVLSYSFKTWLIYIQLYSLMVYTFIYLS